MVVWIIDAEQWPRAMLRAELIERGFDAVGYITVRDAIDSLPERHPDAIVVELRGQPIPLVERLLNLNVPMFIIGSVPEIHDLPDRPWTLLHRPVSIGAIVDHVEALRDGASPENP